MDRCKGVVVINGFFKYKILPILKDRGYALYLTLEIWQARWDDYLHNHKTNWPQKRWAHKRGFYSDRIAKYSLTEINYHDYLSDFTYKRLHCINGIYSRWIDDKLVIRYLLEPFKDYLPKYYFQLRKGEFTPLPDLPSGYNHNAEGFMDLLAKMGNLVFKPMAGSHGVGFYKLSCRHSNFFINEHMVSREVLLSLLNQEKTYIVTEYLTSHEAIRHIYPNSPNTLRFLVINPPESELIFSNAHFRFGNRESGVVDFTTEGGLISFVDLTSGRFSGGIKFMKYYMESCTVHPDTGVPIEGTLPHLELIKETLGRISTYLPQLKFMGYDIIVTSESFKIIEINSHPAVGPQQHYEPMFRDEATRKFFTELTNKLG